MSYKEISRRCKVAVIPGIVLSTIVLSGCMHEGTGSSSSMNSNSGVPMSANANSAPSPAPAAALESREPDRYSVVTTITVQPTGSTPQTNIPPIQFAFARNDTQRRVSFKLPDPIGEVIYLEQPPMK